jgi:multidrug efflux pump
VFSRFFIERPIFAAVISIVITLAGGLAVFGLPLAQYPPVTPPTVQVECNYPGASAAVVAQTIGAPIEQQVNGVEDMLYMSSQSTNDGSYSLSVTFKPGVDLDLAQVLVQNRVNLAMPALPESVRQTGVTTKKRSPDILLTVSLNSPDGTFDQVYLSNYAVLHLVEELARLPGISECRVFGQRDYSMRIWLDPDKLAARGLAVNDVLNAIREQNAQVAVGQIGQPPAPSGQKKQIPLTIVGRLTEAEDFERIVIRSTADGRRLMLRDVARVELSARSHDISNRFDMKPTVGLAVFQLPDANALATADLIKAKMVELSQDFPAGMEYEIGYDTTPFIRESIEEVFKTLRDAVILVAIVVLIFLQGWRPAIIPLIAVPVAIIGTFAAMYVAGFSINNLTLFGLVLAIGIVVDDAIVVVEAVEQYIEQGFEPHTAAVKAMDEVSGPIIAVGFVLTAVFLPCAFISGIIGQFYRQFALTIAISTIISTINSLTLSPALAALLLRHKHGRRDWFTRILDAILGWFFWIFNRGVQTSTRAYTGLVGKLLRVPMIVLAVYGGLVVLTWWGFRQLPTGFIPTQDKGYLVASVQLPDSASAERTKQAIAKLEAIALRTPGVEKLDPASIEPDSALRKGGVKNVNSVAGNSFLLGAYGSNFGSMFIILQPFAERRGKPDQTSDAILNRVKREAAREVPEAVINVFPPPAVSGLGRAGGFKIMVEDRGDLGLDILQEQTDKLVAKGNEQPGLTGLFTVFKTSSPQLFVDVNRDACLSQGVNLSDVFSTLQAYLGSRYVNDFNRFGRTWQVVVQADSQYRDQIEDVRKLMVRNRNGKMVPLGSLCEVRPVGGPLVLTRYNMYPAAAINGNVKQGVSTGEGITQLEELARRELPQAMSFEWTELAYLERLSGNTGMLVFAFSVIFVFLALAALYESWALPLAVILVVPMCVLCSIAGVAMAAMDINIFTQIGFVVLIGLACKNAILIVEFAKYRHDEGKSARDAILEACRLRLRPILMTSFAFILGVLPLVVATGAGAEMRRALGTAVFSGMIGVTFFGILLTPVFYLVIARAAEWQVFRSGILADISRLALDGLSLGPIRRTGAAAWRWLAEATRRRSKPAVKPITTKKPKASQAVPAPPVEPVGVGAQDSSPGQIK